MSPVPANRPPKAPSETPAKRSRILVLIGLLIFIVGVGAATAWLRPDLVDAIRASITGTIASPPATPAVDPVTAQRADSIAQVVARAESITRANAAALAARNAARRSASTPARSTPAAAAVTPAAPPQSPIPTVVAAAAAPTSAATKDSVAGAPPRPATTPPTIPSVTLAPGLGAQRADAVSRLETARATRPKNIAALRALGVAYFKADRFGDAHAVLDHARRLDPRDGVSALYAGMSAEALKDYTNAKAAYNSYLRVGRTRRVRNQISQRLAAMARDEIIASAKAAVANEATLSRTPGAWRTVAVPSFRFAGPDSSLAPLERGLAELVITDLGHSAQLTIVERDRMQALADEIQLGAGDRADSATAARAGRLLQAGRLVSGGILQLGSQLRLSSSVVDVATSQISDPADVTNALDALFAAQKQLVLRIFDQLGVTLTPAERQLVDRTPTTNLNAFLEYSRGLMASDDGRFDDAARFFESARSLDPSFGAATSRASTAQAAALGAQVSATTIEAGLQGSAEGQTVNAASQGNTTSGGGLSETLRQTAQGVNPPSITPASNDAGSGGSTTTTTTSTPTRDGQGEVTGTNTPIPPRPATVILVIRRP